MLDRELPAANSENQQPKNQRGGGALVEERLRREQQRVQRPEPYDERTFEIGVRQANLYLFIVCQKQVLRSRLRELESLVGEVEGRGREEGNLGEPLEVERSLAMLTAQYEKARDCDLEEELNCSLPSGVSVPLGSGSTLTSRQS